MGDEGVDHLFPQYVLHASLPNTASAPREPVRTGSWLEDPNEDREKERLNRFAGHGRPSRSLSFRDAELQPALLWDDF